MKFVLRAVTCLFLLSVLSGLVIFDRSTTTHASSPSSWMEGDITGSVVDGSIPSSGCTNRSVHIGSTIGDVADVCVFQQDGFFYGNYVRITHNPFYGTDDRIPYFVVGFDSEPSAMYILNNSEYIGQTIYTPHSKNLLFGIHHYQDQADEVAVINDFSSKLMRLDPTQTLLETKYQLDTNAIEPLLHDENGVYTKTNARGISQNGKWLVVEMKTSGLVRINTVDFSKLWFSKYDPQYGLGMDPFMEFAVGNDGATIAVTGRNNGEQIFNIQASCGRVFTDFNKNWYNAIYQYNLDIDECSSIDIRNKLISIVEYGVRDAVYPTFNDSTNELTLFVTYDESKNIGNASYHSKWITLYKPGHALTLPMDYLALGDSYSSGEGDVDKDNAGQSYYVKNGEDSCHISTRSYPFGLHDKNIVGDNMASVACSGAFATKDYIVAGDYRGQADRLKGRQDMDQLQSNALIEKIPGRVQQLQFVEKYHPKAVTITAGGNDAGFGDILTACVTPGRHCLFSDTFGIGLAGHSIENTFEILKQLYSQIHILSPNTKIYVVGYPQFIGDSQVCTDIRVGSLATDYSQRVMIRASVNYMNQIIRAAAESAGVKYIDIENSLSGHGLCDVSSKSYMNGIVVANGIDRQQSFHPNADGHSAITESIVKELQGMSLTDYKYCVSGTIVCPNSKVGLPNRPVYFSIPMSIDDGKVGSAYQIFHDTEANAGNFITDSITKGTNAAIHIGESIFAPNSKVEAYIFSSPEHLGTLYTNSAGDTEAHITLPNYIEAGYHVVMLRGTSTDGHQKIIFKTTQVRSSDYDYDGEGMKGTSDDCIYGFLNNLQNNCAQLSGINTSELARYNDSGSSSHMVSSDSNILYGRNILGFSNLRLNSSANEVPLEYSSIDDSNFAKTLNLADINSKENAIRIGSVNDKDNGFLNAISFVVLMIIILFAIVYRIRITIK